MSNANLVVRFAPDKYAAALAYKAWADRRSPFYPEAFSYLRPDADGNWIVPYLGPPWAYNGVPFVEPEGGSEMRAEGELTDEPNWPTPDE